MLPRKPALDGLVVGDRELDAESAEWLLALGSSGRRRDQALDRLHGLLLRAARAELRRRAAQTPTGPELDDLAYHAAADALLAITGKLNQFRGESRFTTWAYKFVIFEVSGKLARHFWRSPAVPMEPEDWARLPDRLGLDPAADAQSRELVGALRRAVQDELTQRQRRVFTAIVLDGAPLDAVAAELGSSRNAVYKIMFDARRKLRASLVANGYLDGDERRRS
jgi:RNA polymerase sigma-70 factor (ECF subfamily)